jgi:hypothetical protein
LRHEWSSWYSHRIKDRNWDFGSEGDSSVVEAKPGKLWVRIREVDLEGGEEFKVLENLHKPLSGIVGAQPSPGSSRFHLLDLFPDANIEGLIEDSESLSLMLLVLLERLGVPFILTKLHLADQAASGRRRVLWQREVQQGSYQ